MPTAKEQLKDQGKVIYQSKPFWDRTMVVIALVLLLILIATVYGFVSLIDSTMTAGRLRDNWVKFAASVAMLVGAILLYMLKSSRAQFIYGLAEIAVGVVANWRSLDGLARQLENPASNTLFARLAVLGGGLYLIGRGVSNVVDGFKKLGLGEAPNKENATPPKAQGTVA